MYRNDSENNRKFIIHKAQVDIMPTKQLRFLLTLLFSVLLSACTTNRFVNLHLKYITIHSTPVKSVDRNAQSQLAETATSTTHSLQQLSAMRMAIQPAAKITAPLNPAVIGMTQHSSLNWSGPVEPLLSKIAKLSHYRLNILGRRPAIPLLVTINKDDVPLAELLRDARYQVSQKATIHVYPSRKIIELRYKPL